MRRDGSDNADTRPRSRPYRLSCPFRLKITRDPRDERDDSEVADIIYLYGCAERKAATTHFDARPRSCPSGLSCSSRPKITRDLRDEKDEKDESEVADNI